jgi:uncharacterized protein (DUF1697 family)
MPRYVAFLRAINVTGRYIKMADLAAHVEALGHTGVATHINSGNVIFHTRQQPEARLAAALQTGLAPLLGFTAEAFVRTEARVHALAAQTAALLPQVGAAGEVNVAFLATPLSPEQVALVASFNTPTDELQCHGDHVLWLCQGSQLSSKFSNAVFERKLKVRTTFRRASMLAKLSAQLQLLP